MKLYLTIAFIAYHKYVTLHVYLVNQSKKINAYLAILTYIIERFLKMKKFLMSVHVCMDILINFLKLEI